MLFRSIEASENSKTIYGLISLSFIIGIFTVGVLIGVFLIILGFVLLVYIIFSKLFKTIFLFLLDLIWPKYQLILISKSDNKNVFVCNKYKIRKIKNSISNAIEIYYAT